MDPVANGDGRFGPARVRQYTDATKFSRQRVLDAPDASTFPCGRIRSFALRAASRVFEPQGSAAVTVPPGPTVPGARTDAVAAPLAGTLVVEDASSAAQAYCGRLFALFGARVAMVEGPAGAPIRNEHPPRWPMDVPGPAFLALAGGKESFLLDPVERGETDALLAAADVIIAGDELKAKFGSVSGIASRFPTAIVASISPFGDSGPYADFAALPGVLYALGGYAFITGYADREPLIGPASIPAFMAGLNAYTGILAALRSRATTGFGGIVEVSELESLAAAHQWTIARYTYNGHIMRRNGSRYDSLHPVTYYDCADGTIAASPSAPDQLDRMLAVMGMSELLEDPQFSTNYQRILHADAFDAAVAPWFRGQGRDDLAELLQTVRVPAAPAFELDELLHHKQLVARGFWQPLSGTSTSVRVAGPPFRILGWTPESPHVPALGEHRPVPLHRQTQPAAERPGGETRAPLEGIRVLDLTRVWSGPLATRILADLGAEVIKVEHPAGRGVGFTTRPDPVRASFYPDNEPGPQPWNSSAAFNKLNRNKKSMTLDLTKPGARELFLDLVRVSDVVIENYSPRVMGNLGIGFEALRSVNPAICLVSMPGYGLSGPLRDGVAYGTTLDAECGLASLLGYPVRGHNGSASHCPILSRVATPLPRS